MTAAGTRPTQWYWASRGQFLGFGAGGSGNHQIHGLQAALGEIGKAAGEALRAARVDPAEVAMGCFCLSGADLPEDFAMLQEAVESLRLSRVTRIKNDTLAALRAGTSRPWGVVIICGSGFNAAGRAPDGREIVLPGLGPISGDWGGGLALGMEMIRAVMRSWDGRGKATLLTRLVLDHFGLPDEGALLSALYHETIPGRGLLAIVPLLFEGALAGDEVSRELVSRLGDEAGLTAAAAPPPARPGRNRRGGCPGRWGVQGEGSPAHRYHSKPDPSNCPACPDRPRAL